MIQLNPLIHYLHFPLNHIEVSVTLQTREFWKTIPHLIFICEVHFRSNHSNLQVIVDVTTCTYMQEYSWSKDSHGEIANTLTL